MHNVPRFLKSWSDHFVGNIWMQLEIAREVVHRLESTCDRQLLLAHEEDLCE
jgi:hypothetical protein